MSQRGARRHPLADLRRSFANHPVARETAVVLAVMAVLAYVHALAAQPIRETVRLRLEVGTALVDFYVDLAVGVALVLLALGVLAGAYVRARNLPVGLAAPGWEDRVTVAGAVVVPAALVAAVTAVALATGTAQSVMHGWLIGSVDSVWGVASVLIRLVSTVGTYLIVAHVVVQSTLRTVTTGRLAALVTTVVVGLPMQWSQAVVLSDGLVVFAALVVPAIAVAVVTTELVESTWLRVYAALPLVGIALITVLGLIMEVQGVANAALSLATVAVVATAAVGYERTDSLLVPALTFGTFYLAKAGTVAAIAAVVTAAGGA